MFVPVLLSLACLVACWRCCHQQDSLDQAELLPFADDPEAARRMTAATGRHCEVTTEPSPASYPYRSEHDGQLRA